MKHTLQRFILSSTRILAPKQRSAAVVTDNPLASEKSVLDVLEQEIRRRGFVGSSDVPKLVFLILYTRHFDRPVSMLIKGSSGSGKSHALKAGLQFIPKLAYELYAGMSAKAIVYNKNLDLKHKHLILQEAAGYNEGLGNTLLRQLLSEGEIRYSTVQSTRDGMTGEDLPVVKGPTGLLMTTTADHLHPEDESRMLSYHVEESAEKTREVLLSQALLQNKPMQPVDTMPWFALDQMVTANNKDVHIPFAETLARRLPTTHNRIARDFPHVLSLIKAHALVHQCTRSRTDNGAVIATVDDYAAIHALVAKPLGEGLEAAVSTNVREVVEAVQRLNKGRSTNPFDPDAGVSQRQVADELRRDRSIISRNASIAIDQGFLEDLAPGQGRESRLVTGQRELPTGLVLPKPADIDGQIETIGGGGNSSPDGAFELLPTSEFDEFAEVN